MGSLGHHTLLELWGISPLLLDDLADLERRLVQAARHGGAHVIDHRFQRFEPHGISGVVILAESHITVHTWPELGYAAVDVFTCGAATIGRQVSEQIIATLSPASHETRHLQRGVLPEATDPAVVQSPASPETGRPGAGT